MLVLPDHKHESNQGAMNQMACHPPEDTIFDMDVTSECEAFVVNIDTNAAVTKVGDKAASPKLSIYERLIASLGRLCRCISRGNTDTSTEDEEQEVKVIFKKEQTMQSIENSGQSGKSPPIDNQNSTSNLGESSSTMSDVPLKSINQEAEEKSPLLLQVVQQQQVITQSTIPMPPPPHGSASPFAMVPHPLAMIPTTILLGMLPSQPVGPLLPPPIIHRGRVENVMQGAMDGIHQVDSTLNSEKICLVLDLDETLVHSSFSCPANVIPDLTIPLTLPDKTVHEIYVCKRPGVDVFLERALRDFEVVIFTASLPSYADPVINFLDTQGRIKHRLYRDACVQLQGLYIKDLSRLGRPLDKTLLIDNSPASFLLHPEHAMAIKSWFSDAHDSELHRLGRLLDDLHSKGSVAGWRNAVLAMEGHPVY